MLIHIRFAFHYAHCHYNAARLQHRSQTDGGLDFPGEREPDYLDFAYFSFAVGMTSQVSDVVVTSRAMRRLILMHGQLSFGFNVVVVALSVNIFVSLLERDPTHHPWATDKLVHRLASCFVGNFQMHICT